MEIVRLAGPTATNYCRPGSMTDDSDDGDDSEEPSGGKPRIWSLADVATSGWKHRPVDCIDRHAPFPGGARMVTMNPLSTGFSGALSQNFQPWAFNGHALGSIGYCDDGVSYHTPRLSNYTHYTPSPPHIKTPSPVSFNAVIFPGSTRGLDVHQGGLPITSRVSVSTAQHGMLASPQFNVVPARFGQYNMESVNFHTHGEGLKLLPYPGRDTTCVQGTAPPAALHTRISHARSQQPTEANINARRISVGETSSSSALPPTTFGQYATSGIQSRLAHCPPAAGTIYNCPINTIVMTKCVCMSCYLCVSVRRRQITNRQKFVAL